MAGGSGDRRDGRYLPNAPGATTLGGQDGGRSRIAGEQDAVFRHAQPPRRITGKRMSRPRRRICFVDAKGYGSGTTQNGLSLKGEKRIFGLAAEDLGGKAQCQLSALFARNKPQDPQWTNRLSSKLVLSSRSAAEATGATPIPLCGGMQGTRRYMPAISPRWLHSFRTDESGSRISFFDFESVLRFRGYILSTDGVVHLFAARWGCRIRPTSPSPSLLARCPCPGWPCMATTVGR